MQKTYTHIFFDLDHTLWDFDKNSEVVWRKLFVDYKLAELGISDFDVFFESYLRHNLKLWERYRKGFIKRDELRWKRVWLVFQDFSVRDLRLAEELGEQYLNLLPQQIHLLPQAREVLNYCRSKNYMLHLITDGFENTQRQKLANSELTDYFTEIITSESSMCVKPNRDIFDFALAAACTECHDSLMIGDALEVDIVGARNAGWDQVYFNPARLPHSEKVTHEISHLRELMEIL